MAKMIQHTGIVESIGEDTVRVRILQEASCSACQAKATCMAAEVKEKIIDAEKPLFAVSAGDEVEVQIEEQTGWKALTIAYLLPFAVLMSVLFAVDKWLQDEAIMGVLAVVAVGVYYIVLSFFKGKLKKHFSFTIKKT